MLFTAPWPCGATFSLISLSPHSSRGLTVTVYLSERVSCFHRIALAEIQYLVSIVMGGKWRDYRASKTNRVRTKKRRAELDEGER